MCKPRFDITLPQNPETGVRANWTTGPRTAAWDELWRRILADVLHSQKDVHDEVVKETRDDS